jgi:hypothetical protein
MILEDSSANLTLDEIVLALEQQLEAINAEGELFYKVLPDQLRADTARFLNNMVSLRLLRVSQDSSGQVSYSISDDVHGTTSAKGMEVADSQQVDTVSDSLEETIKFSKRETFSAFLGLLAFDLLLKLAGFQALIKKVENWPTAEPLTIDREICQRVRGIVDRAQMYYPKKAMCLQHSAVVTCLLRRRGVPAEMVLAAQEFPPKAHAWAEVSGEVVNDKKSVRNEYLVLRRL